MKNSNYSNNSENSSHERSDGKRNERSDGKRNERSDGKRNERSNGQRNERSNGKRNERSDGKRSERPQGGRPQGGKGKRPTYSKGKIPHRLGVEAKDFNIGEEHEEPDTLDFSPFLKAEFELLGVSAQTKSKALKAWWKEAKMPHKASAVLEGNVDSIESHTGVIRRGVKFVSFEALAKEVPFPSPPIHQELYSVLNEQITKDHLDVLSKAIRFLTIRQNGGDFYLFLQASPARQILGKQIKKLAEWLERTLPQIKGLYCFFSTQDRRYSTSFPQKSIDIEYKKYFGTDSFFSKVGEEKFFFTPMDYYRPNQAVLEPLVGHVKKALVLKKDEVLVDLYSAGGFFSEMLASSAKKCLAVDIRKTCLESFKLNAHRRDRKNVQYFERDIHGSGFGEWIGPQISTKPKFILNPPVGVLPPQIINMVCSYKPERIIRIYQDPENIQKEIRKWRRSGYILQKCLPVDSFQNSTRMDIFVTYTIDRDEMLKAQHKTMKEAKAIQEKTILFQQ